MHGGAAAEVGLTWAGHVPAAVGLQHAIASRQSTVDHLDGMLEMAVPEPMRSQLAQPGNAVTWEQFVAAVDVS